MNPDDEIGALLRRELATLVVRDDPHLTDDMIDVATRGELRTAHTYRAPIAAAAAVLALSGSVAALAASGGQQATPHPAGGPTVARSTTPSAVPTCVGLTSKDCLLRLGSVGLTPFPSLPSNAVCSAPVVSAVPTGAARGGTDRLPACLYPVP